MPSLLGGASTLSLLSSHYSLSTRAARDPSPAGGADVVVATRPRRRATPAARFWLDRETGLVLRREVYDESGRITRASAFVEITVGEADDYDDAAESAQGHRPADGLAGRHRPGRAQAHAGPRLALPRHAARRRCSSSTPGAAAASTTASCT